MAWGGFTPNDGPGARRFGGGWGVVLFVGVANAPATRRSGQPSPIAYTAAGDDETSASGRSALVSSNKPIA